MDWNSLLAEYPALHPAQLHFILSQYLLPSSTEFPTHWTPPEGDAIPALNTSESSISDMFHSVHNM